MDGIDLSRHRVEPVEDVDLTSLITGDKEHANYCELAGIEFEALLWYIIPANQKRYPELALVRR
jgi:hypothetical protein